MHAGKIAARSSRDEFDKPPKILVKLTRKPLLQFHSALARVEHQLSKVMPVSRLSDGLVTEVEPCPMILSHLNR